MADETVSYEQMSEIHVKLQDIYNSQAALNQKIAVVQLALAEISDEALEASLNEAYGNAQRNAELIKDATHQYELAMNARRAEGA